MVVMILPFFFLIVTLVQMIGAEINEEKTSKSMEYIITNVSPKDHLIAKIVSCTAFTFIQILSLVLAILIASFVKSQTANIVTDVNTSAAMVSKSLFFILFFICSNNIIFCLQRYDLVSKKPREF